MDPDKLHRIFTGEVFSNDDFRDCFEMIQPLYNVDYDPEEGAKRLARIPFRYETHNWAFSRNQRRYDLAERLHEIQVPMLVTVGRHDWITPLKTSEEIAANLPNSELVIFENSGHSPQLEEKEHFLDVVRSFLARHVPVPTRG